MRKWGVFILLLVTVVATCYVEIFFNKKLISVNYTLPDIVQIYPDNFLSDAGTLEWDKYEGRLKEVKNGFDIFMFGFGYKHFDHNAKWNYDDTPFWGKVLSFSDEYSTVKVVFYGPQSNNFLGKSRELKMVSCPRDITFLADKSFGQNRNLSGGDFYKNLRIGDNLISYCLDKQCKKAGGMCKIIRSNENEPI